MIELRRAPGAPGFQETAFTPVDWQVELPDVIVLDGCTLSVEERVATDGRTVASQATGAYARAVRQGGER